MALWLRIMLWIAVAVTPGGILLLPLLAGDAVNRHRKSLPERQSI